MSAVILLFTLGDKRLRELKQGTKAGHLVACCCQKIISPCLLGWCWHSSHTLKSAGGSALKTDKNLLFLLAD